MLPIEQYFALWRAIEEEVEDPGFPLTVKDCYRVESFSVALFSTFSCPDLGTALRRLAKYKRLIAPMRLLIDVDEHTVRMRMRWLDTALTPPPASTWKST